MHILRENKGTLATRIKIVEST